MDLSPALKQLMYEADHSPLFSAKVTDQCSCNCTCVCLHCVNRETLPFTIILEELLQYLCVSNSVTQKLRAVWSHGTMCRSAVLCCVITQIIVI